jgi:predicted nucleic acid-binding protein
MDEESLIMIVDTDILIDAGRSIAQAVDFLQHAGARSKNELRAIEKFLRRFQVVKVNETISDTVVDLVRQYRLSHGLLIPDALIAATAIVMGEPLATKNRRDYQFIAGLTLQEYLQEYL